MRRLPHRPVVFCGLHLHCLPHAGPDGSASLGRQRLRVEQHELLRMPSALASWSRPAILLAGLALLAALVHAQDSSLSRRARITYLTSASAYIDAGREAGLREASLCQVMCCAT